jgi:hypothetical protein
MHQILVRITTNFVHAPDCNLTPGRKFGYDRFQSIIIIYQAHASISNPVDARIICIVQTLEEFHR